MPCNRISRSAGAGLAFVVMALSATAQTPPDAGSQMKHIKASVPGCATGLRYFLIQFQVFA